MSERRLVQWRVGAVVLLAAGVLLAALVVTGPLAVFSGQRLAIDYGFCGPIKPGAAVRVSGMVVGSVEEVELLAGQDAEAGPDVMVRVHVRLEERARPVVTDKARYYVTTLGVLGEHYVDIEPARGGRPLDDGARVRGVDLARSDLLLPRAAGFVELLRELLDEGRPEALELMHTIAELVRRLDDLLRPGPPRPDDDGGQGPDRGPDRARPDLAEEARSALTDLRDLLAALKTAVGDGTELSGALADARVVLGEGGKLARDLNAANVPGLLEDGRRTAHKTEAVLDGLQGSVATDARRQKELAHTFEKTFWELEAAAASATRLLEKIERGEGSVGQAFQDDQLIEDLRAVLQQLRRNPAGLLFPRTGGPPARTPTRRQDAPP